MGCIFAVQTPPIQTKLSQKAIERINNSVDGKISFKELSILPSGALLAREVLILDKEPYIDSLFVERLPIDTLFYAKQITATFTLASILDGKGLHFGRVAVDDALFYLCSEPNEHKTNIARIFGLIPKGDRKEPGPDVFDMRRAVVRNFRYRYIDYRREYNEIAYVNYRDIDIVANVKAHALKFTGGRMHGIVDEFDAREKSGYSFDKLTGRCTIGHGKALIEDIHLVDAWSDAYMHKYCMYFYAPKDFKYFTEKVELELDIKSGTLGEPTLRYLAHIDPDCYYSLDLKDGYARGYVNDFKIEGLSFTETISGLNAKVDGKITGLPEFSTSVINANLEFSNLSRNSAESIIKRFAKFEPDLSKISSKSRFKLKANLDGAIQRLKLRAALSSKQGTISLSSIIHNLCNPSLNPAIAAQLRLNDLLLRDIYPDIPLNHINLYADAKASLGKSPSIAIDSLYASSWQYKDREYQDLQAKALLDGTLASLGVKCSDPKLNLELNAAALLQEQPHFKLDAIVHNADLYALDIDRRELGTQMGFKLDAYFSIIDKFFSGEASVSELCIRDLSGEKHIEDSYLEASYENSEQVFHIQSPIVDAQLCGTGSFEEFINDLQSVSIKREFPVLYTDSQKPFSNNRYEVEAYCRDSRTLLSYLYPGLYIADSTLVKLQLNERGRLNASIHSPRLALGSHYIKDVKLDFDNFERSLNARIFGSELRGAGLFMQKPSLIANAEDNHFGMALSFDAFADNFLDGEILIKGKCERDHNGSLILNAYPLSSYIDSKEGRWELEESAISFLESSIHIDQLRLSNEHQAILIDGGLSKVSSDSLCVDIQGLKLGIIDNFLQRSIEISGQAEGKALLCSGKGRLLNAMHSSINIDSLKFGEVMAGDICLESNLDSERDDIQFLLKQVIDNHTTIFASGQFYPSDESIYLDAELKQLPIQLAEPFVSNLFNELSGNISGSLLLQGQLDDISFSSSGLSLNDTRARLLSTGVPYRISGPLRLDNNGLHFDRLDFSDESIGNGILYGSLLFQQLKSFSLDAHASFQKLKVLDNLSHSRQNIRGLLRLNGNASVTGPLSAINIDAELSTIGSGSLFIPTASNLTGTTSNLLSFTEPTKKLDPYEEMLLGYNSRPEANQRLSVNAHLNASSEIKTFLERDNASGNMASFSGNGDITLAIKPDKDVFELSGDYVIDEGEYNFYLPGIISRNFNILKGSSLRFGGDIDNTEIDINAQYKLKTSLTTLITDTTSVSSRRQVDCGIRISERLSNPRIDFSIDIPDLDPTTKSQVETALNTSDKVQRQFLALLVMGSFIPDESSGVFNGSNVLLSNATELMSNQLNNIFQKLQIPLDIGIGYQTANSGNNIFDVAISTQLFNDRVIVGGSVGNRNYGTGTSYGDVVGDLDIQVKLDREGKYRVNLFSHSVDQYSSYLDLSQRNGVGVNFQKGFKSFKQIFSKTPEQEQMVSVSIEANDKDE